MLKASATGGASLGTYEIEVGALAKAGRNYTNGFTSKSQTGLFGTGTLSITVGEDDPVGITVDGTDTLETLVTKINASDARVTAGILFDGSKYRLQISGNETGAANALVFDDGTTTLGLADEGNQLVYSFDAREESTGIAPLLKRLGELGVDFKDLHTDQSSLEEIFVDLVEAGR